MAAYRNGPDSSNLRRHNRILLTLAGRQARSTVVDVVPNISEKFAVLPLSPNVAKAVEKLFHVEQRREVVRLLTEECADNLPNCKDADEYGLEDLRFSVLKLSQGKLDELHDAIRMAKSDWRDVMISAGSTAIYKRRLLGSALERNARSDATLHSLRWNAIGAIAAFISSFGLVLADASVEQLVGVVVLEAVIYGAGSHMLRSWPSPPGQTVAPTFIAVSYFGICATAGYFAASALRSFL